MWVNLTKTNQPTEHGQMMTAYGECQQVEGTRPTDNKRIKMLASELTAGFPIWLEVLFLDRKERKFTSGS